MNFRNQASGTITANGQSVTLPYRHFANGGIGVQVTGTWVATLQFEVTIDGTNYVALPMANVNSGATASTTTANGIFAGNVVGVSAFRVTSTAYTSGTATVTIVGLAG